MARQRTSDPISRCLVAAGTMAFVASSVITAAAQDCGAVIEQFRQASVSIGVEGTVATTGEIKRFRGTGVIVSDQGYVLTNSHVVNPGPEINNITITGAIGSAAAQPSGMRVVDEERTHDLALLKFNNTALTYRAVPSGDRATPPRTGMRLCSFGYPLDLEFHPAPGILGVPSGPGGWWTLDIATNPGESGAPVFDQEGGLLGLRVAGRDDAVGIYYMVPLNLAARLLSIVPNRPTLTPEPSGVAKRFWQAAYVADWTGAYALFPESLHKLLPFSDFVTASSNYLSQFNGAPLSRDDENSIEAAGVLTVTTLVRFDGVSRFREYTMFNRMNNVWVPWRFDIAPIEWPIANNYQFVATGATAIVKSIATVPAAERAKFEADLYEGKYIPPPGWQLVVDEIGSKFGDRTCDVSTHEEGSDTSVVLRRVLDGCSLTKNSRIRILGRLQTADTSIRVEAVRFWK